MSHKRIKFTGDVDGEKITGWHLLVEDENSDGEYTACGTATPEYDTIEEIKEHGGITCAHCLAVIRYYKAIKL